MLNKLELTMNVKGYEIMNQEVASDILEILFPKQPLRARALEIICVHKIEVSEGGLELQ